MTEVAYTILVTGTLSAWFLVSVLAQFRFGWVARMKQHDLFALLPKWTFFAPRPGTADYRLLYRDKLATGELSYWREITFPRRSALTWILNPSKRCSKSLSDLCASLIRLYSQARETRKIIATLPYVALAMFVSQISYSALSHSRQFAIVQTHGHGPEAADVILFLSAFHSLEEQNGTRDSI